jgi:hypothetical protein
MQPHLSACGFSPIDAKHVVEPLDMGRRFVRGRFEFLANRGRGRGPCHLFERRLALCLHAVERVQLVMKEVVETLCFRVSKHHGKCLSCIERRNAAGSR